MARGVMPPNHSATLLIKLKNNRKMAEFSFLQRAADLINRLPSIIADPVNVRGAKDLLGQASFGITEKHYIMAQSRLAGRALAHVVDAARK
jgi:hypothetical protein